MTPDRTIELRGHDIELLRRVLDTYLTELKTVASRADRREVRDDLWKFESELEDLRARLGE